jgi:hypothetical protein
MQWCKQNYVPETLLPKLQGLGFTTAEEITELSPVEMKELFDELGLGCDLDRWCNCIGVADPNEYSMKLKNNGFHSIADLSKLPPSDWDDLCKEIGIKFGFKVKFISGLQALSNGSGSFSATAHTNVTNPAPPPVSLAKNPTANSPITPLSDKVIPAPKLAVTPESVPGRL